MKVFDKTIPTLGGVLKQLIEEGVIPDIAELARITQIPYQSIYKIVAGITTDPKLSQVLLISKALGLTVEQVAGLEPLANKPNGNSPCKIKTFSIPFIKLAYAWDWQKRLGLASPREWVSTQKELTELAFCTEITSHFLEEGNRNNFKNVVILDPGLEIRENDYVLVLNSQKKSAFLANFFEFDGSCWAIPLIKNMQNINLESPQYSFLKVVSAIREY